MKNCDYSSNKSLTCNKEQENKIKSYDNTVKSNLFYITEKKQRCKKLTIFIILFPVSANCSIVPKRQNKENYY